MTLFGEALRVALASYGLSQSAAGRKAGINHSYISRLLAGQRDPSRETVTRIVSGCGFSAEISHDLYAAAGFIAPEARDAGAEPEVLAIVALLRDETLPEGFREGVRAQIAELVAGARQLAVAS